MSTAALDSQPSSKTRSDMFSVVDFSFFVEQGDRRRWRGGGRRHIVETQNSICKHNWLVESEKLLARFKNGSKSFLLEVG